MLRFLTLNVLGIICFLQIYCGDADSNHGAAIPKGDGESNPQNLNIKDLKDIPYYAVKHELKTRSLIREFAHISSDNNENAVRHFAMDGHIHWQKYRTIFRKLKIDGVRPEKIAIFKKICKAGDLRRNVIKLQSWGTKGMNAEKNGEEAPSRTDLQPGRLREFPDYAVHHELETRSLIKEYDKLPKENINNAVKHAAADGNFHCQKFRYIIWKLRIDGIGPQAIDRFKDISKVQDLRGMVAKLQERADDSERWSGKGDM